MLSYLFSLLARFIFLKVLEVIDISPFVNSKTTLNLIICFLIHLSYFIFEDVAPSW